jgi:malate synthase
MSTASDKAFSPLHITVLPEPTAASRRILTPEALAFVEELALRFAPRVDALLNQRRLRQARLDAGERPNFLPDTAAIRAADWKVAAAPADLRDRRVEITGPVDRKMVINALNSGARCFMADFEDASSPTWEAMIEGQVNMYDAVRRTIGFTSSDGREYRLNEKTATLLVRPRGWHLPEKHVLVNGRPVPAGLFDFGLHFFHNAEELVKRGSGPYFYLPKMESHLEARLWNDVFLHAQATLGLPRGTIRATVLIETILAAFEMDEILWELREHSAGLNCGRWDYIFSIIKTFRADPSFVMPDRAQVTMEAPCMRAYSRLLIRTCHRRGAHAMGGMAAQLPVKGDPEATERNMARVRADKEREARDGHDGTWVSHPMMVPIAAGVFDQYMPGENQIDASLSTDPIGPSELLAVPTGTITRAGLKANVAAALRYTEAWVTGRGAVPIFNLMEDAATAEISRAQIWQWIRYPAGVTEDGERITAALFQQVLADELASLRAELGEMSYARRRFDAAATLLDRLVTRPELPAFLTLEAYGLL